MPDVPTVDQRALSVVEIVTALAFVLQGLAVGDDWPLLGARLVFTALLIVLFGTDLETLRLPNVITLPGIVIGLVAQHLFCRPDSRRRSSARRLARRFRGGIRWLWQRMRGRRRHGPRRREDAGDDRRVSRLAAGLVVLFLASLAGAVIGVTLIAIAGRTLASKLPFGTFLALGAFAASLVGTPLFAWYMQLYR